MKFSASYSTICADELLSRLVPQYLVESPLSCQFWRRGVNDTYQVHCAEAIYSLRVYRHKLRSTEDVNFEIAALNYLHEHGANVAYPIGKRGGGFVTELESPEGLRYAVMTTHAKGSVPHYSDTEDARLFGASVAELHLISEGFETEHKRARLEIEYLLSNSLDIVRPYLKKYVENIEILESEIRRAVDNVSTSNLDVGFCHGDCHGSNVHKNNGALTHFDFDCCGFGFRVFDLATFYWGCVYNSNGSELCSSFLEGYKSTRKIDAEDLALLPVFMLILQIWFMALHISNARDFGYDEISNDFIDEGVGVILKYLSKEHLNSDQSSCFE